MIARSLLVSMAVLLLLGGCRKPTVESYRIPKEKDPEMPLAAASGSAASSTAGDNGMAAGTVPTADAASLTWNAPTEWKEKPASAMRKATYAVEGDGAAAAELSITAFPNDVGGEVANLNRWRGQIQLPPVDEAEAQTEIQRVEHNGLKFGVVDLVGTGATPQRILAAFVPHAGATWFFKLSGPDAVVTKAKPAFLAFLQTVKPAASTTK